MSAITTHVLDTQAGRPAEGIGVVLELRSKDEQWRILGRGRTDEDGRVGDLLAPDTPLRPAIYRLTFAVSTYFEERQVPAFYPQIVITFRVQQPTEHYHVPVLLSPFGYTTYRGS